MLLQKNHLDHELNGEKQVFLKCQKKKLAFCVLM